MQAGNPAYLVTEGPPHSVPLATYLTPAAPGCSRQRAALRTPGVQTADHKLSCHQALTDNLSDQESLCVLRLRTLAGQEGPPEAPARTFGQIRHLS